jgi:hypothetical protein
MIYGRDNSELMERIRRHPDFRDFVVPLSALREIRDANFFLRSDGLLAFSEGYFHPEGKLIANIIYIPDERGNKKFFGVPYSSIIKQYGSGGERWIPFKEQLEICRRIDPATQADKPLFAENKCVFNRGDFIGYVPPLRSLEILRSRVPKIDVAVRSVAGLLKIDPGKIGCTGSMAFGNISSAHDFDLVFYGRVADLKKVISAIFEIVRDPKRRVFEMGMHWAIRFYDAGRNMVCPFFSYTDPEEIPLPSFTLEVVARDVEAAATVANDDHTGFMPTYLPLSDARLGAERLTDSPALIIYHGGKRGEYRAGDRVRAKGHYVRVTTPRKKFDAVLVTDMDNTEKI